MSEKLLIEEALKRREVFANLEKHLEEVKRAVLAVDEYAEVYLFGSVAEGRHTLSSDIDILIVTDKDHVMVRSALWRAGVRPPFELHIQTREKAQYYIGRAKTRKI
ncbi:MAG: nucleotidyltransferase domain-containing protein [Candidatus Caldarchaeum sp.]|uniref:Nucleotidyltransferase domain-containing protein n=1 Tax=Caldiarchaeum subterraneum TaxID=311458 RepID=A0A7C5Q949_CALS0